MTASNIATLLLVGAALTCSLDDSEGVLRANSIELTDPAGGSGKVTLGSTRGGGLDIQCSTGEYVHGTVSLYGKDGGFELLATGPEGAQVKVRLAGAQASVLLQWDPVEPAIEMLSMQRAAEIFFLGGERKEGGGAPASGALGISQGSTYVRLGPR